MVDFQLSEEDAAVLKTAVDRHLEHMMVELAHTENPALQASLRKDYDRLESVQRRLTALLAGGQQGVYTQTPRHVTFG